MGGRHMTQYEEPTPQVLTAWVGGFVTGIVISFLLAFALALFFMSYAVDVNSSSECAQILANASDLALTGVQV